MDMVVMIVDVVIAMVVMICEVMNVISMSLTIR